MQASLANIKKTTLTLLMLALFFLSPSVFAKKDLFANEPAEKSSEQSQQLVNPNETESSSVEQHGAASAVSSSESAVDSHDEKHNDSSEAGAAEAPTKSKASFISFAFIQDNLSRLKQSVLETKDDLFGKKNAKTPPAATSLNAVDEHDAAEASSAEPVLITSAEAAQKAQRKTEGQIINVRRYEDSGKILYAVKLLQKNGRMKTVDIDAVSGDIVEETAN